MINRFFAYGLACITLCACRANGGAKNELPVTEHPTSYAWVTTNGLLGLDISYPDYFSLDKDIGLNQADITLTNNYDWSEAITIFAYNKERLEYCKNDTPGNKVDWNSVYIKLPDMNAFSLALKEANDSTENTDIPAKSATGVIFTSNHQLFLPCFTQEGEPKNVWIMPVSNETIYIITYPVNKPLATEIVNKLNFRSNPTE